MTSSTRPFTHDAARLHALLVRMRGRGEPMMALVHQGGLVIVVDGRDVWTINDSRLDPEAARLEALVADVVMPLGFVLTCQRVALRLPDARLTQIGVQYIREEAA